MRIRPLFTILTAAALMAGATAGCEKKSGTGGTGAAASQADPAASTKPIVIGSTLSLSGAFAATGQIHKIAGEEFLDRLNKAGGLLGRQVQWTVRDDESDQAKVATLYEQLISQDKVDLIMGPYATPNILSAMAVAERHGYVLPQHTSVLAPLMKYACQFPGWSHGFAPNEFVPGQLFDAMASLPRPPKKIAILTNQNGSTDFVSYGAGESKKGFVSIAKERGLDVVAEIKYPPGAATTWAPIATQVRDAKPDLVINSGLGIDAVNLLQAMAQLNYSPPLMFSLFPSPGPLLQLGPAANGFLAESLFEPNQALLDKLGPVATEIVNDFKSRATAAKLPYTVFETQAAASWNAWEILVSGVKAAGSVDNKAICDALHKAGADTTFSGHLTFDPARNNFWPPTTSGLKQIQDGNWVSVWPAERAAAQIKPPPG
ncbi:MAG TPA: amino acid ABC transporter substrate-binding protein [Kofleriaceae bacterium]|nr:amino acid ABC transporter substrate-binding protein [Kofleriaceae bacterium]